MEEEFGSIGNVGFLDSSNATMYDSQGNVCLCKCGKPAGSAIIGKHASIAYCGDCYPFPTYSCHLLYKPPIVDN